MLGVLAHHQGCVSCVTNFSSPLSLFKGFTSWEARWATAASAAIFQLSWLVDMWQTWQRFTYWCCQVSKNCTNDSLKFCYFVAVEQSIAATHKMSFFSLILLSFLFEYLKWLYFKCSTSTTVIFLLFSVSPAVMASAEQILIFLVILSCPLWKLYQRYHQIPSIKV